MKNMKRAGDKMQEICEVLKRETLEPAEREAQKIIEEARRQAEQIREEAESEAQKRLKEAAAEIEQERRVFASAMDQASKQAVEKLRQTVTEEFFGAEVALLVEKGASDSSLVVKLIEAIVKALDKEGLAADLSVFIPKELSVKEVAQNLSGELLSKLQGGSVVPGSFKGGVKVRLEDKKLTLDITEGALKELLAAYLKKPEFRELIFRAA